MALNAHIKLIKYWGQNAPANRLMTPESLSIVQDVGFDADWEVHTKEVPSALWNHIWRSWSALFMAARRRGSFLAYDEDEDYDRGAVVEEGGNLYRTNTRTGPATFNSVSPTANPTLWEMFASGETTEASATAAGIFEQATSAELIAGTEDGSAAVLFVSPNLITARKASSAQALTGSSASLFLTAANIGDLRADDDETDDSTDDEHWVPVSQVARIIAADIDTLFDGVLATDAEIGALFGGTIILTATIDSTLQTAFDDGFTDHYSTPEIGPATTQDSQTLATATLPTDTASALTSRANIGTWTAVDAGLSVVGQRLDLEYPRAASPYLALAVLNSSDDVISERVIPYGMVTADVRMQFPNGALDPRHFHGGNDGSLRFAVRAGSNSLPAGTTLRLSALGIYDA